MQNDINARQPVPFCVLGNALDGLSDYRLAHSLWEPSPALVRHFIDVAIGARKVATAVHLEDELSEGNGLKSRFPDLRHVEVE